MKNDIYQTEIKKSDHKSLKNWKFSLFFTIFSRKWICL